MPSEFLLLDEQTLPPKLLTEANLLREMNKGKYTSACNFSESIHSILE
jgi:hypothetical protein